ncbi:TPA: hypothetical protein DCR49_07580 [Candidatus Delongbacteria bacterium]|nr:hypothetical protein [Candidatus Delongbacteria bacterium]
MKNSVKENSGGLNERITRKYLIISFTLFFIIISTLGYYVFDKFRSETLEQAEDELISVSEMKIQEIEHWRKERIRNLENIQNEVFGARIKRTLDNPDDPAVQKEMLDWFIRFEDIYGYDRICLHDLNGAERMRTSESEVEMPHPLDSYYERILNKGEIVFEDFYFDNIQNKTYLPMLAGMFDYKNNKSPLGTIVVRIDPEEYLYPLLKSWPIPRKSAELHLVRKEDGFAVFLNHVKGSGEVALKNRININENKDLPISKAVSGFYGIYKSKDINGKEVLSFIQPIPDTPWFLIAKIETDEINSSLSGISYTISGIILLLMALLATGITYIIKFQKYNYYKQIAKKSSELAASEENLRITMASIGDGVIATDEYGKITLLNKTAEILTGWKIEEAKGKDITQVFRIINALTRKEVLNPVDVVMRDGRVVGLANHTVLISKSGKEYQIADSAAPILDETGKIKGMILVFSDVTEKYKNQEKIEENERFLNSMISNLKGMVYRCANNDHRTMIYLSKECKELTGFYPEDFFESGKIKYNEIIHESDRDIVRKTIATALITKEHFVMEYRVFASEKEEKWVLEKGRGVFDESGNLRFLEGFITDINMSKTAEIQIRAKSEELEKSNSLMIGREVKMVELKKEINSMLKESGKNERYVISE